MAQVQMPFNWKDAELVDFKVVNEDWQYYNLSDKSKIRVKLVLGQVWRSTTQYDNLGQPLYVWNSQNITALVSFPSTFRGEPTNLPLTPDMVAQSIDEVVEFETSGKQDEWSAYTFVDGSKLRLRLNLTSIARTKLRGQAGEPIYNVSGGVPNYRLTVSPSLIKKLDKQITTSDSKSSIYR